MVEVLLYNYYFDGIEKPMIIQAYNKAQARELVVQSLASDTSETFKGKTTADIISETVCSPVTGITSVLIDNIKYLWGGPCHGTNGWIPATEYEQWAKIFFVEQVS